MRQAFRRYAFPMMIIAAVLAAALPLNSFALDISTVNFTDDFAYNTLASNSWVYLTNLNNSSPYDCYFSSSRTLSYLNFDNIKTEVSSNVFCRSLAFNYKPATRTFELRIPLFLQDIYSLDFNFYFGISTTSGSSYPFDIVDVVLHTNSSSIDLSYDLSSNLYSLSADPYYIDTFPTDFPINSYNIYYSSTSSFDAHYISFIYSFTIPSSISTERFSGLQTLGIDVNSSFSTLSSNVDSIMQSHSILAQLLDTVISQQSSNHAQIIDYLDQILAAVESGGGSGGSGSDPGTGEGEEILQEGAIKQEQLEQLGDALSNVPKPSIENITQSFDPADTLISADPGMIQNALSIVYSWDKFLILLGLFIAVGTISYIIFGKKS